MAAFNPERPNRFLLRTKENEDLNQYWYSKTTLNFVIAELASHGTAVAFLSTPSVYFTLPKERRAKCKVFDLDEQWSKDPGFVRYDFGEPLAVPDECKGAFDYVMVDPPFITREVWEQYAATVKLLLREGGKVLLSTIAENEGMMHELFGARPVPFLPSIPHLVYQYRFYANYEPTRLAEANPEIPEE